MKVPLLSIAFVVREKYFLALTIFPVLLYINEYLIFNIFYSLLRLICCTITSHRLVLFSKKKEKYTDKQSYFGIEDSFPTNNIKNCALVVN